MVRTVKDMMAEANTLVERIGVEAARRKIAQGALVLDVRDAPEVENQGKVAGSLHVSRGMLEFRADPDTPYHDKAFQKDRTILVYCASGGRSALSGKLLKEMGYENVYNLGGFKDWVEAGGDVEHPVDKGM
mgnify:FL=1